MVWVFDGMVPVSTSQFSGDRATDPKSLATSQHCSHLRDSLSEHVEARTLGSHVTFIQPNPLCSSKHGARLWAEKQAEEQTESFRTSQPSRVCHGAPGGGEGSSLSCCHPLCSILVSRWSQRQKVEEGSQGGWSISWSISVSVPPCSHVEFCEGWGSRPSVDGYISIAGVSPDILSSEGSNLYEGWPHTKWLLSFQNC